MEFPQLLSDMIGDLTSSPEPIEIKLFSQDQALLREWAPKVADAIKKIKGVVDVLDGIENTISGPAMTFKVDPAAAARAGFTAEEIELDASALLQGEPADTPGGRQRPAYTIRVRYPQQARASINQIRNTLLVNSTGKTATLGSLATIQELPGQTEVRRENLQRGRRGDGAAGGLEPGRGHRGGAEGRREVEPSRRDSRRVRRRLQGAAEIVPRSAGRPGAGDAAGVYRAAVRVRIFAAPLAILASALLSTSGVFLALLVTDTTFNIASFMGLIMVIGIVAKNGILLLDADQKFHAEQGILGVRGDDARRASGGCGPF